MATGAPNENSGRARPRYDALVDVSTELFGKHGFEGTSVRMIADALGVKSGSLYSHIKSKDEVLHRIVLTVADAFFDSVKEAGESPGSPMDRLRAMCRAHLEVIDHHGPAVRVYYDEWRRLGGKSKKQILTLRKAYENCFTEVIEEGIEDGSFGAVNVPWVTLVILSACNWSVEWYSHDGPRSPAEIADGFMEVLFDGIRSDGPAYAAPRRKKSAKRTKRSASKH